MVSHEDLPMRTFTAVLRNRQELVIEAQQCEQTADGSIRFIRYIYNNSVTVGIVLKEVLSHVLVPMVDASVLKALQARIRAEVEEMRASGKTGPQLDLANMPDGAFHHD